MVINDRDMKCSPNGVMHIDSRLELEVGYDRLLKHIAENWMHLPADLRQQFMSTIQIQEELDCSWLRKEDYEFNW